MIRTPITFPGGKPLTRSVVAQIVQVTARYESRVMIEHDQKIVNAKVGVIKAHLGSRQNVKA